jgi:hypothetical protein
MKTTHKPTPGTISISLKHEGGGRITAHYFFPDFAFSETAWDELRKDARRYTQLSAAGRLAHQERRRERAPLKMLRDMQRLGIVKDRRKDA